MLGMGAYGCKGTAQRIDSKCLKRGKKQMISIFKMKSGASGE